MTTAAPHRSVLMADDRALVRAGLRALLERVSGVEVVGETGDGREAVELVRRDRPGVVLLDAMLPGLNGFAAAAHISRLRVPTRVLMMSRHASADSAGRAFAAGASGYLNEGSGLHELHAALDEICAGRRYLCRTIDAGLVQQRERHTGNGTSGIHALTPRQWQILQLIAEGHSTRRIAERLSVGVKTVETHRAELMRRLCIYDVAGLVRFAIRTGLLPPELS